MRLPDRARVRFVSFEPLLVVLGTLKLAGIDWVIVGGESGAAARPLEAAWVRDIRDQCACRVPFFFKQWGGVHKKQAGHMLDGRAWREWPTEMPSSLDQTGPPGIDRETLQ